MTQHTDAQGETTNIFHIFHESTETINKIRTGEIKPGSIVWVKYPSGNADSVRVHGWDSRNHMIIGSPRGPEGGSERLDPTIGIWSLVKNAEDVND